MSSITTANSSGRMWKGVLALAFYFLLPFTVLSQTNKLDFLKTQLLKSTGQEQLNLALEICSQRNSMDVDSLWNYVQLAESLNKELKNNRSALLIDFYKTCYIQERGQLDSAIRMCTWNILRTDNQIVFADINLKFKNYKGILLIRNSQYKEAIKLFYEVLNEAEKNNDTLNTITAENGIGWANMELANYTEAKVWLSKAERASLVMNSYARYPVSNLAAIYNSLHQNDSALLYIDRAIKYAVEAEDLKAQANGYAIKSDILIDLKRSDEAEVMMKQALAIRRTIGDDYYVVSDMGQLGIFYANTHQCEKGIAICNEGIALAMQHNYSAKYIILYEALADNYKSCKNYESYSDVLHTLLKLKDSLYIRNSAEALAEMQTKYELENKEKIIIKQEYSLTKRNYLIYGSVILFIMAGTISFLVFNQYRHRQKSIALREISGARENERKRIASELHDNIGTQLSYISRKIEYIKSNDKSSEVTNDKDALSDISGSARRAISDLRETIWALKKEEINMNDLTDRVKNFASKQLSNHPGIKLVIEEQIKTPILFSSVESLNIFRILQEAIYNAIQHSAANVIYLNFNSSEDNNWIIKVADDGIGFDSARHFENHFGLENMTERAKEIKAMLKIESIPGKGTSVILSYL